MPPDCSETSALRHDVERAVHAFYSRWPYGEETSSSRLLHFPELREALLTPLVARGGSALSVSALTWALNDEGAGNMFDAHVLQRHLAGTALRTSNGTIDANQLAPAQLELPASAEMANKVWDVSTAIHAFHVRQ